MAFEPFAMTAKHRTVMLLVIAEVLAMSLWFVSSAVLVDLRAELALSSTTAALLASSVPAGFVVGALLIASSCLADRLDPRRLFAVAAVLAATVNAAFALLPPGGYGSIAVRLLTGLALAGVYPVGLKADYSPPALAGSLMSLQTAIGFALSNLTVQATPFVANVFGWPVLFWILALGPLVGIVSMRGLR